VTAFYDILTPKPSLEDKVNQAIERMGKHYLCHPCNHVKRKTPMPTTHTLKQQWAFMKSHG